MKRGWKIVLICISIGVLWLGVLSRKLSYGQILRVLEAFRGLKIR